MSQLLVRLAQQLEATADEIERAEIIARIASNLARMGRFDEAKQQIAKLRLRFGDGSSGRTTVWIMLAEGLIFHYQDLSPKALDRITRAQLLGVAMGYDSFVAIASAWKAHIEFEISKFDSMIRSLELAQSKVSSVDGDAQTRIAIVLCNCFLICGNHVQSQKWFMRGREYAIKNGDQASIEAMLYNKATFGLAWIRAERCFDGVKKTDLSLVRQEIRSARNLQDLTRVSALEDHIHLWGARLLILDGEYSEAIERLSAVRNKSPFADHNFSQAFIDLEVAFCLLKSGRHNEARVAHQAIDLTMLQDLDVDEQLVATWMLHEMSEVDGQFGDSSDLLAKLEKLRSSYAKSRADLAERLLQFEQI